jgi:hypothetical protein
MLKQLHDISTPIIKDLINNIRIISTKTIPLKFTPESYFISDTISNYIANNTKYYEEIIVQYQTNTLKFYIDNMDNFLKYILFIKAFYVLELFNKENINLDIYLFTTPFKKTLPEFTYGKQGEISPENNSVLGVFEVNSGVSYLDPNNRQIIIFREEEVEKVMLHELIHSLDIDKCIKIKKRDEKAINNFFNLPQKKEVKFYEIFTEATALVLHTILNSILNEENVEKLFENEIIFSKKQYKKVLPFYKNAEAAVLEYYMLKLGVILDVDEFINRFMFNNSFTSKEFWQFIKKNIETLDLTKLKVEGNSLRMTY